MSNGPGERDAYVAARRAVARRLHPDLGGDPQEYLAAMATLDRQYPGAPDTEQRTAEGAVQVVARHRVRAVVRVKTRQVVASVRGALPGRWPGARRYGRL